MMISEYRIGNSIEGFCHGLIFVAFGGGPAEYHIRTEQITGPRLEWGIPDMENEI